MLPNPKDNEVCYKILKAGALIVKNILRDNGLHQTNDSDKVTIFWSNGSLSFNFFKQLKQGQKYNHFPQSKQITRKDYLFINIMKMKAKFPNHYDIIPDSFLIPKDSSLLISDYESH